MCNRLNRPIDASYPKAIVFVAWQTVIFSLRGILVCVSTGQLELSNTLQKRKKKLMHDLIVTVFVSTTHICFSAPMGEDCV